LLRIVDRLAHRIVVNARALRQHLAQFGVERERIFVSHNGLDTREFYPAMVERPEFLRGASLVIGSLAVLREEKRIDVLLEAFAKVLPSDRRMRLLVVGTGDMRERLLQRRSELGLDEACHFVATTADVPQWMRMLDIYVLPSRSEGFPNTVLEAMGCGCAVVASNVGGVPELIEHGRNGLLSAPADADDLARQLAVLIQNPELRKQMGERAATDAKTSFSMEAVAGRIESMYDSLLSETPPIGSSRDVRFQNHGLPG
jgi:glycosyltransferase involved in cell wall biosynthesis